MFKLVANGIQFYAIMIANLESWRRHPNMNSYRL